MFISRECDYALRILRALSCGKQCTVKEICDMEDVPSAYTYKILRKLEVAGLVSGRRGVYGGFTLRRKLSAVTLLDVYTAIEGEVHINACMYAGVECTRNSGGNKCKIHNELFKLQEYIQEGMRTRTVAMMAGLPEDE